MTASKAEAIRCRAQVSDDCCDGELEHDDAENVADRRGVYPEGADEDRTFDVYNQTVVCDPCYRALGSPPFDSIAKLNGILRQNDALVEDYDPEEDDEDS